jgi:hypothetical protein
MPIIELFSQASFDPETVEILASAFDIAWQRVVTSGSPVATEAATATRETLAKNIIAAAKAGERDKNLLVESALSGLTLGSTGRCGLEKRA